jgi:hypothetical protein
MIDRVVKSRGELLFLLRGEPEVGKEGEEVEGGFDEVDDVD